MLKFNPLKHIIFVFRSGTITALGSTSPRRHGDESGHCQPTSSGAISQNLYSKIRECEVSTKIK